MNGRTGSNARGRAAATALAIALAAAACQGPTEPPIPGATASQEPGPVIVSLPAETETPTATPRSTTQPSAATPTGTTTPTSSGPSFVARPQWFGGKELRIVDGGSRPALIGVDAQGTLYAILVPDSNDPANPKSRLIAVRPDGSTKPGWPVEGVELSDYPLDWRMNGAGTIFLALGPANFSALTVYSISIVAIGSDGHILPGWPYVTPRTLQAFAPKLELGPDDSVCLDQVKAGITQRMDLWPETLYCLGKNGQPLAGWPYSTNAPMLSAVAPNGSVYTVELLSRGSAGKGPYSYRIRALGQDGKPLPGWDAPTMTDTFGPQRIIPRSDGHVILLTGVGTQPTIALLDPTGRTVLRQSEPVKASTADPPRWADAFLAADSSLYVAVASSGRTTSYVNAYDAAGKQKAGWPKQVGYSPTVVAAPDGHVWIVTIDPAGTSMNTITLVDPTGQLASGYPKKGYGLNAWGFLGPTTPVIDREGTLYQASPGSGSGYSIFAIPPG